MIPRYPEFFNDVFGPIMQPGSSSHFAGPCRIGLLAASLLEEEPERVEFVLDPEGTYAGIFGHMNEDLGLIGGVLGLGPEDPRLFEARELAASRRVDVSFVLERISESTHPNAVKIRSRGRSGKSVELVGDSTGGGMVELRAVQGFPVSFEGDSYALLDFCTRGRTSRPDPETILESGVSERSDARMMSWYKLSEPPEVRPPESLILAPILPVPSLPGRRPQLFDTMVSWRALADKEGAGLYEVALRYEEAASCWPREPIIAAMRGIARILDRQVRVVYDEDIPVPESPDRRRDDRIWPLYESRGPTLGGSVMATAIKRVLGVIVKTPGVPIVPGPMGTGGGYLYSALSAVRESRGYGKDDLLRGLFIAAGVGAIAYSRSEPTGEVIGCAGECGLCSAMASAAIVEMAGGAPVQVENAASFALQAAIGLPCDPIPGGREQPCLSRIISAVTNAISFADLALAGSDAVLPFHDALEAADRVGRALSPDLRCNGKGGCCATPSGKILSADFDRRRGLSILTNLETSDESRHPE
jgi:L-serine dehydratase